MLGLSSRRCQTLYCLNADTGDYLWEYQTGRPIFGQLPALLDDGTVVFGSEDNRLLAVDSEGFLAWAQVMDAALSGSPVIGPDGTTYAQSASGSVYAVNLLGDLLWHYAHSKAWSTSPILGDRGELYLADESGAVLALNTETGTRTWEHRGLDAPITTLNLSAGGQLLATTLRGQMRALQTGSTGLAQGMWPKAHGNLRNTGKANS